MPHSAQTMTEQIALAATAFRQQWTGHEPKAATRSGTMLQALLSSGKMPTDGFSGGNEM
jgi:hypothetical protein